MSILSMLKIVHCTKFEHWCSYANTAADPVFVLTLDELSHTSVMARAAKFR